MDVRDTAEAMHKVVSAMGLSKNVTLDRWILSVSANQVAA